MLRWRLAAAAAILVPLVGLLVADFYCSGGAPGIWLLPLGLVIGQVASAEVLDLLRTSGHRPLAWTVYVGVALIFLGACAPMAWGLTASPYPPHCPLGRLGWPLAAVALALALAFVGEMRRFEQPGDAVLQLALSVFTIVYLGVPLGFAAALRQFHNNEWGMAALVSVIFIVKLSDAGAYFCGKAFGRHKLAPHLSPGKTVEGVIGGIITAVVASWIFFSFFVPLITRSAPPKVSSGMAVYGIVLSVVGLIGDLGESLVKRDVARKDSSSWLPGLGGVLDVMDSLLFALPAAYICWSAGIVGPR